MLVCYVEGDSGHLMNEVVGQQQWRTRVKGSVASFQMPWEDIIEDLKRNIGDTALSDIPRAAATVKYMLRVHLKVGIIDFAKKLKELKVRPFIVLLLLHWLIDRNHPVFKGKGTCAELKARMQAAVEREYPETEVDVPYEKREGHIPASLLALLDERHAAEACGSTDDVSHAARAKRIRLTSVNDEKNATPGTAARDSGDCLADVQPVYVNHGS